MDTDAIFGDAAAPAHGVTGKWAALQVAPNPGTGELLNIGVVFAPSRGRPVFRLLPSARAFGLLFGSQGADNLGFLLRVLHEHLGTVKRRADVTSVSPQVHLTPWAFAAGNNPTDVVNQLYASTVSLARAHADAQASATGHVVVRTQDLRDHVRGRLPVRVRHALRNEPVQLADREGKMHRVDMPIWHDHDDMFPILRFGTLFSLQYKDKIYRKAELGPASQYFSTALASLERASQNARALFVALRPTDNAPGFTRQDIIDIENEFDNLTWGFQKMPNVGVHMAHNQDEAVGLVQQLLQ